MFVLMSSHGEYSDRSVNVEGYTFNEDRAKELVIELTEADKLQNQVSEAKSDMLYAKLNSMYLENPRPTFTETRPVFNQTYANDKEYVKQHTKNKHEWQERHTKFVNDLLIPYDNSTYTEAEKYVEENFDVSMIKPLEWTDSQFWYDKVKELK